MIFNKSIYIYIQDKYENNHELYRYQFRRKFFALSII